MSEQTPTTSIDPLSISEILSLNTQDLTDTQIDILIAPLRNDRVKLLDAEQKGKAKPKSETKAIAENKIIGTFEDLFEVEP
jgi:hypothetical protein